MKSKNVIIGMLLFFCCITVLPIVIIILEACNGGYEYSILKRMIDQME
jgi:hypothetical protein